MQKNKFDFAKKMRKLLESPVEDPALVQRGLEFGIKPKKLCHGMVLLMALLDAAEKGNMTAMKEIRVMLEESSAEESGVQIIDDIPFD